MIGRLAKWARQFFATTARKPEQWFIDWLHQGRETSAGVKVSQETALTLSAVWACVRLRSQAISSMPLILYRRLEEGRERATDDPLYQLFKTEPNREEDILKFLEFGQASIDLWGNFYAEKTTDRRGRLIELVPLHPANVTPIRVDSRGNKVPTRKPGTRVMYEINEDGVRRVRNAENIVHIPSLAIGSDGLTGLSVIGYQREVFGGALASQEYGNRFFGQGAAPGGWIKFPGRMTPKQKADMIKSWNAQHQTAKNSHKIAVFDQGAEFNQIGMPLKDVQFLELRKFHRSEIASVFNVPSPLINDHERSTFNNVEQLSLNFRVYTMRPMARRWEAGLNRQCLTPLQKAELYLEFLFEELLSADLKSKGEFITKLLGWGVYNVDEAREKFNLNPVPGGKRHWRPTNMAQLTDDTPQKTAAAPAPENTDDDKQAGGGDEEDTTADEESEAAREARLQAAHDHLLVDRLTRMARVEVTQINAAAARDGNFLAWFEGWSEQAGARLLQSLEPVLALRSAQTHCNDEEAIDDAAEIAVDWMNETRQRLLDVCGRVKRPELVEAIDRETENWVETRPLEILERIKCREANHAEDRRAAAA